MRSLAGRIQDRSSRSPASLKLGMEHIIVPKDIPFERGISSWYLERSPIFGNWKRRARRASLEDTNASNSTINVRMYKILTAIVVQWRSKGQF